MIGIINNLHPKKLYAVNGIEIKRVYCRGLLVWSNAGAGNIASCFATGQWLDEYPWTDDTPWAD